MSWEKIGVRIVSRPVAYGSGIYVRIPKDVKEAYDLAGADKLEVTIERVKRPEPLEERKE